MVVWTSIFDHVPQANQYNLSIDPCPFLPDRHYRSVPDTGLKYAEIPARMLYLLFVDQIAENLVEAIFFDTEGFR